MDKQSLLWSRRLLLVGGLLCLLRFTMNQNEYHLKDIGVILVCAGLIFLTGFEANKRFNVLLWFLILSWISKVIQIFISYLGLLDSRPDIDFIVKIIPFFLLMFSPAIFCFAMFELSKYHHMRKSIVSWRNSTILNTVVFVIPGMILLFSYISQYIGLSSPTIPSYLGFQYHFKALRDLNTILLWFIEAIIFSIPFVNLYLSFDTIISEQRQVAA